MRDEGWETHWINECYSLIYTSLLLSSLGGWAADASLWELPTASTIRWNDHIRIITHSSVRPSSHPSDWATTVIFTLCCGRLDWTGLDWTVNNNNNVRPQSTVDSRQTEKNDWTRRRMRYHHAYVHHPCTTNCDTMQPFPSKFHHRVIEQINIKTRRRRRRER